MSANTATKSVMARFLAARAAALIGMLFVLSLILFGLQQVSGQDPIAATMQHASAAAKAAARHALGLDAPASTRYFRYVDGLVHLNVCTSFRTHHPVLTDIKTYLPATAELVFAALVVAVVLGVAFALSSVLRWPGAFLYRGLLYIGHTTPSFLLGIFGIIVFYQDLGWLPNAQQVSDPEALPPGWHWVLFDALTHGDFATAGDDLTHLMLPALALGIAPALAIGRILRSTILLALDSDYVRTARSKGLTEWRVITGHVLRNSVTGASATSARMRYDVTESPN
jgi:peptide/nickel transport system permease protein